MKVQPSLVSEARQNHRSFEVQPLRRGKRWTREEQNLLIAHIAVGTEMRLIAKKLGRSFDAVEGRLNAVAMRHLLRGETSPKVNNVEFGATSREVGCFSAVSMQLTDSSVIL